MTAHTGVLGFNINAFGVSDWNILNGLIQRLRPAACLVMDADAKRASALATSFTRMMVILRVPYERDNHHQTLSARTWMERMGALGDNNIWLQYLNEPEGYLSRRERAEQVDAMLSVMSAARLRGRRLVVANFGVGHPDTDALGRGEYDGLIRELSDGYHVLGLHEYALGGAIGTGDTIGRCRRWRERAKAIGVNTPRIVITETGVDVGGGARDGWRDVLRGSDMVYASVLFQLAAVYAPLRIPALIFGYGFNNDAKWRSFDISFATDLLDRLIQGQVALAPASPTLPPPPPVAPAPPPLPPLSGTLTLSAAELTALRDKLGQISKLASDMIMMLRQNASGENTGR